MRACVRACEWVSSMVMMYAVPHTFYTHTRALSLAHLHCVCHVMSGMDWYVQQAARAVNQAVGRVIRHRNDYGAVVLLDERFKQPQQLGALSAWARPHVKTFPASSSSGAAAAVSAAAAAAAAAGGGGGGGGGRGEYTEAAESLRRFFQVCVCVCLLGLIAAAPASEGGGGTKECVCVCVCARLCDEAKANGGDPQIDPSICVTHASTHTHTDGQRHPAPQPLGPPAHGRRRQVSKFVSCWGRGHDDRHNGHNTTHSLSLSRTHAHPPSSPHHTQPTNQPTKHPTTQNKTTIISRAPHDDFSDDDDVSDEDDEDDEDFDARRRGAVVVDAAYVDSRLDMLAQREDLARYVL